MKKVYTSEKDNFEIWVDEFGRYLVFSPLDSRLKIAELTEIDLNAFISGEISSEKLIENAKMSKGVD